MEVRPGTARLAAYHRRVARQLARFPYVCQQCFEPCMDPLGHVNQDGCFRAAENAAHRAYRTRLMMHRAAILDQRQSPS